MGSLKVYATVAGFLALASSVTATRAADLLPPPPPPPAPVEPIAEFGGGWYLRGDVGVGRYQGGKVTHDTASSSIYDRDFGSGAFAGAGIGYQFNSWFRADVTGEYRFSTGSSWHDKGALSSLSYTGGGVTYYAPGMGYESTRTDNSAAVVLVNGYFDLGTWYGVTPFLGAGIGWAHHNLSNGGTNTLNAYGYYADASGNPLYDGNGNQVRGASGVSGGAIRNKSSGDLAWALHAGLAYDVTPNVKLELAYRYLNMGSVRTGIINCYCGEQYNGFKMKNLEAHDIKLGMRWALGGPASAPAYEPAPLMRKY